MRLRSLSLTVGLLHAGTSLAQAPQSEATARARVHFQAALTRAQQGDLAEALTEFEAAYAAQPNFSVLYNIGQTRAALGRPVEALAAFERYLSEGGQQLTPSRRSEVASLQQALRLRIGTVKLLAAPEVQQLRVWLDGRELSAKELAEPLAVSTGEHSVLATAGGPPQAVTISVTSERQVEVSLAPPVIATPTTQLLVRCAVPEVVVKIPGLPSRKTPIASPLLLSEGTFDVSFTRVGYRPVRASVVTKRDQMTTVDCKQRPLESLPASEGAKLVVTTNPRDATVLVDGEASSRLDLPRGLHELRVERDGFLPLSHSIVLDAGKTHSYHITLAPTAATRSRERTTSSERKTFGVVVASAGLTLLAGGVSLYAWNSKRYDDWKTEGARDTSAAASLQRTDDIAIGLTILGAGGMLGGGWTLLGKRW